MNIEFLSPEELAKVIVFNKDDVLKEAVKKIVLHHCFYSELLKKGEPIGMDKHWVHSIVAGTRTADDATVGRMVRITAEASALLEEGFKELNSYESEVEQTNEKNPAI